MNIVLVAALVLLTGLVSFAVGVAVAACVIAKRVQFCLQAFTLYDQLIEQTQAQLTQAQAETEALREFVMTDAYRIGGDRHVRH